MRYLPHHWRLEEWRWPSPGSWLAAMVESPKKQRKADVALSASACCTPRSVVMVPQIRWCDHEEKMEALGIEYQRQLLQAAATANVPELRRLIALNADVNIEHETLRTTPLHFAAAKGNEHMVTVLLQAHANVNATTWNGSTALHIAAQNGRVSAVNALLDARASPSTPDGDGKTPLDRAVEKGKSEVVTLLSRT